MSEKPLKKKTTNPFQERQMRKASPGRTIVPSPGRTHCEETFPAVTKWVNDGYGHIEIGDQEGFGFIARALDYGGLVFEDDNPTTLADALAALEKRLTQWFKDEEIKVS